MPRSPPVPTVRRQCNIVVLFPRTRSVARRPVLTVLSVVVLASRARQDARSLGLEHAPDEEAVAGRHGRPVALGVVALLVGTIAVVGAASAQASSSGSSSRSMSGSMSGEAYWAAVGGSAYHPTGVVRRYYLQAEEVVWAYAPTGRNQITGLPFDRVADTYVKSGPGRIGSKYLKCLYRGYTDATFAHPAAVPAQDGYLGFTGLVIRGAVGDTIKVVFRNTCRIAASVHPHGVFYAKASEGAPYADNTSGVDKADDAVPTGGRHTYTWLVPDRAGPGPHDRQLGDVDVPLAHRRGRRHPRRAAGLHGRDSQGDGQAGRQPQGRRP